MDKKKTEKANLKLKHPELEKVFIVAENNLGKPINLQATNKISDQLNTGWRLPGIDELETCATIKLGWESKFYWRVNTDRAHLFTVEAAWHINIDTVKELA